MTEVHMKSYDAYVRLIEDTVREILLNPLDLLETGCLESILDGQPGIQLRRLVDLKTRKSAGSFFTSSALRERALPAAELGNNEAVYFDSSIGGGDLLVEVAKRLPLAENLVTTLQNWGHQLRGVDIHPEFVRLAKARLVLVAVTRGVLITDDYLPPLEELFPHIRVGDGLCEDDYYSETTHVVINPSFALMPTPENCDWTSGKVSAAAVFVEHVLTQARAGTHLTAILPDVLRAGSRYEKWRHLVQAFTVGAAIESVGQFDPWTDVDVFILRAIVQQGNQQALRWWHAEDLPTTQSVGQYFKVSVGPVVPHRDPKVGEEYAYLTARQLSGSDTYNANEGPTIRYAGTTFQPPFVVVRRTSRPGNGRVITTLVTGQRNVALENHLIVMKPISNSMKLCRELVDVLSNVRTTQWLDERIRCRHLTVSIMRELPWWRD